VANAASPVAGQNGVPALNVLHRRAERPIDSPQGVEEIAERYIVHLAMAPECHFNLDSKLRDGLTKDKRKRQQITG